MLCAVFGYVCVYGLVGSEGVCACMGWVGVGQRGWVMMGAVSVSVVLNGGGDSTH